MKKGICKDCTNREICGKNNLQDCEHYDIALTRSEVIAMLSDARVKNPSFIPEILNAVKKTYHINLAY